MCIYQAKSGNRRREAGASPNLQGIERSRPGMLSIRARSSLGKAEEDVGNKRRQAYVE